MSIYRQIEFYVNVDTGRFINDLGGELTVAESPSVYFGEHVIFCVHFVNSSLDPVPFQVTDALTTAIDNNFLHTDSLMVYSDNSYVNMPGDWDMADRTQGRMSIRINCHTDGYEQKIGTSSVIIGYAEIHKVTSGVMSVLLQDQMNCHNVIDKGGSGPLPLHDYWDVDESDSRYQFKDGTAVAENMAMFDAFGNTIDSGITKADVQAAISGFSLKADKVVGAVAGNFSGLDGTGNLTDSGYNHSSFALAVHRHNQDQSHDSPDTDTSETALHHTLGTGAYQSAVGNHTHTQVQSHFSPDTNLSTASLHHTLGTGPLQAASGAHTHVGTYAPLVHAVNHKWGGSDLIKIDELGDPDNNTNLDASTSAHGLLPKLTGSPTQFLDGTGSWNSMATESPALKAVMAEVIGGF